MGGEEVDGFLGLRRKGKGGMKAELRGARLGSYPAK